MEHVSFRTSATCLRKTQWGESSMFFVHNFTVISSLFSFSCFFRIVLTSKCFCERALASVERMSKKAFCPCLHTPSSLISGLTSTPVKPFNYSFSIFCSFGLTSTSFKVVFSKFASKSRTLLCLIIMKPPLLQFIE